MIITLTIYNVPKRSIISVLVLRESTLSSLNLFDFISAMICFVVSILSLVISTFESIFSSIGYSGCPRAMDLFSFYLPAEKSLTLYHIFSAFDFFVVAYMLRALRLCGSMLLLPRTTLSDDPGGVFYSNSFRLR